MNHQLKNWVQINNKSQLEKIRTILKQIPDKDIKASYKVVILEEIDELAKLIESKPLGEIDKRLSEIESNTISIVHKLLEIIQSGGNFGPIVEEYFNSIRQTNSAVKIYDEMINVPREIKEKLRVQIIKNVYEGLYKLSGNGKSGIQGRIYGSVQLGGGNLCPSAIQKITKELICQN